MQLVEGTKGGQERPGQPSPAHSIWYLAGVLAHKISMADGRRIPISEIA